MHNQHKDVDMYNNAQNLVPLFNKDLTKIFEIIELQGVRCKKKTRLNAIIILFQIYFEIINFFFNTDDENNNLMWQGMI